MISVQQMRYQVIMFSHPFPQAWTLTYLQLLNFVFQFDHGYSPRPYDLRNITLSRDLQVQIYSHLFHNK